MTEQHASCVTTAKNNKQKFELQQFPLYWGPRKKKTINTRRQIWIYRYRCTDIGIDTDVDVNTVTDIDADTESSSDSDTNGDKDEDIVADTDADTNRLIYTQIEIQI